MSGVDLAQWLTAQLDEDERIARAADPELNNLTGCTEVEYPEIKADEVHALRHSPARVLREIDGKRKLLALLPELEQADQLIAGEWGSSDDLADKLRDALLAAFPKCGATTVFWPEVEACDAVCVLPRGHGGTRHQDETLGGWDEGELTTSHPSE